MLRIGERNNLRIDRLTGIGAYLIEEEEGTSILLPNRENPKDCKVGEMVDAFIYRDSDDRLVATTRQPYVMVGEFANLEVVGTSQIGAFLNWGLAKDILLPFREQEFRPKVGQRVLVHVYLDRVSDRIVATARLHRHLDLIPHQFQEGQEVDLIISKRTDLGFMAIVNNTHTGLISETEAPDGLKIGQTMRGFIGLPREDEKINLLLNRIGYQRVQDSRDIVLFQLQQKNGFLPLNDKSVPVEIRKQLRMSKKTFKQVIGALYKERLITIEQDGIRSM